jgi:hypothetical protein
MKSLILALVMSMSALNQQSQPPSWVCDHKLIEEITPYTSEAIRNIPGRILSIEEAMSICAPGPCKPAAAFSQEEFINYVLDIAKETEKRRTGPSIFDKTEPTKVEFETHSRGEIGTMTAIVSNARVAVGGPRIFTQLSKKGVTCGTWETYRKPF